MVTRTFVCRDYSPARTWGVLDWCMAHGADEFSLVICVDRADSRRGSRFFRVLRPLQLRAARRSTLDGGLGAGPVRRIPLWRLNETSIGFLRATCRWGPLRSGTTRTCGSKSLRHI